jgi:predicted acylesterase/phospholipase RssA
MKTHLIFSGGNIWGIVYLGILRYLYINDLHINIKDVAGTSFGATFAIMFALKIPVELIEEQFYIFSENEDMKLVSMNNIKNFFSDYGLVSTHKYLVYLKKYIQDTFHKDDLTFIEVSKMFGINLHINALCINTGKNVTFNINNTPNTSILQACAASMSIPFIYKPERIDNKYYIDAGMIENIMHNEFCNVQKEFILNAIINIDAKPNFDNENLTFFQYIYNIFNIHLNILFTYSMYNYIKENKQNCIVITDKTLEMETTINSYGIYQNFDRMKIDKCIMHGFQKSIEFFEK